MDRDTKKKLSCPKCGNDELQFISVQKEKEKSELQIAITIFAVIALIISTIVFFASFSEWVKMESQTISSDILNTNILVLISFIGIFLSTITLSISQGFLRLTNYEENTNFFCQSCGNQKALQELIIQQKK